MKWNPEDYARHSDAQLKWARELLRSLELKGNETILDVGCGDGKVTADLAMAVPEGKVVGVDSSAEMIAYARQAYPVSQYPNLSFVREDARSLSFDAEFDLYFSNAVLHWVDDHPAVLRGAYQSLKPNGQLIISCGGSGNAVGILQAFADVMAQSQWSEYFTRFENPYFFHGPKQYTNWLKGFEIQKLELIPKDMTHQEKTGLEAWIRTTWMPFTERVPLDQRENFIAHVVDIYLEQIPIDEQGLTHVRMVRLEVHAIKT